MYGSILIAVAIAVSACAQSLTDPRLRARFADAGKQTLPFGICAVHAVVAIAVLIFLLPKGSNPVRGELAALLGWLGLCALALLRFAEKPYRPLWLLRFGLPDVVCLIVLATGLAVAMR
jgi:hypothetical protein